jgi:hypothetical protein
LEDENIKLFTAPLGSKEIRLLPRVDGAVKYIIAELPSSFADIAAPEADAIFRHCGCNSQCVSEIRRRRPQPTLAV